MSGFANTIRRIFGLSVIVAYELYFGAFRSLSAQAENLARVDALRFEIHRFHRR